MERKDITALVMIDLSAAFDSVDDEIMLQFLDKKFGLCDTVQCGLCHAWKIKNAKYA